MTCVCVCSLVVFLIKCVSQGGELIFGVRRRSRLRMWVLSVPCPTSGCYLPGWMVWQVGRPFGCSVDQWTTSFRREEKGAISRVAPVMQMVWLKCPSTQFPWSLWAYFIMSQNSSIFIFTKELREAMALIMHAWFGLFNWLVFYINHTSTEVRFIFHWKIGGTSREQFVSICLKTLINLWCTPF